MTGEAEVRFDELRRLLTAACLAAGCSAGNAASLVDATLSAHQFGSVGMGIPHMLDYLEAFEAGRINGHAEPAIEKLFPAIISADAKGGIAQTGFDRAFPELLERARTLGVSIFAQFNSYTSGELGYYVRRLCGEGLMAMAATNGPALMAASPGGNRVYCTNPLAFAAPSSEGPVVIDQASSATAFVNIVAAASRGQSIPEGWATDSAGAATTNAASALEGALLPFGGGRGANVALMVELLAAGMTGANWSLDANDFRTGNKSPSIGLTVIALVPPLGFAERAAAQLARLENAGVHVPGKRSANPASRHNDRVRVDKTAFDKIAAFAARPHRSGESSA
jgi:(2R)-3-sulfolactate dehydrogenase (NADP+)